MTTIIHRKKQIILKTENTPHNFHIITGFLCFQITFGHG